MTDNFSIYSSNPLLLIALIIGVSVIFAIVAPIVGCFFAGLERKIAAKMQGRVGPPLLQPYYDVRKLLAKDKVSVNGSEGIYVTFALIFAIIAGGIFYAGANLLLCVFVLTLSTLLFIMAAYSSRSPYAEVGAGREIVQVLAYEPTILLMCVAIVLVVLKQGSLFSHPVYNVIQVFGLSLPLIVFTWPIFICLIFVLIIKMRKSPFDISMSHHAHQEIVRGMTTEMSGPTLAKIEIMHWVENVLFMGWIGMFFITINPLSLIGAVVACLICWFIIVWIDNNFARVKWQAMLKWSWILALVVCGGNIVFLMFIL